MKAKSAEWSKMMETFQNVLCAQLAKQSEQGEHNESSDDSSLEAACCEFEQALQEADNHVTWLA